jgi:hypothetical protein
LRHVFRLISVVRLGESAPTVCEACAVYQRRKQEARTLAGSPSRTAARTEIGWTRTGK